MFALLPATTSAAAAEPIAGRWLTAEKDAMITIGKCGAATCGRISKFLIPLPNGSEQRDINNPDPAKKTRKLLGLPVLSGFAEEASLWCGRIYDPKSGKSYRSVIRRKGPDTLEVKGCISFICQTQIWKRVP